MTGASKLGPDSIAVLRGGVEVGPAEGPALWLGEATDPGSTSTIEPSALPPLYARWMSELLGGIPSEPLATCNDCAMHPLAEPDPSLLYFDRATKCCTFLPQLPNYLVGAILADPDPDPCAAEGRRTVLARIAQKKEVTPLGLGRTSMFTLHYRHDPQGFGRKRARRCPHYVEEGGRCGVWKHRESTCATWFCKHERGSVAVRFWNALRDFLSQLEAELAWFCAQQLGLDAEPVRAIYERGARPLRDVPGTFASHLLGGQLDGALDRRGEDGLVELWGEWRGREVELYQAAAELIADRSWSEVARICDTALSEQLLELQDSLHLLRSTSVPELLSSSSVDLEFVQIGAQRAYVHRTRPYDPRLVTSELRAVLPVFDGSTSTRNVLAALAADGVELEPALLRKLVDLGILVALQPTSPDGQ